MVPEPVGTRVDAPLIAALAELGERRLYLGQGYTLLFAYCTKALSLSEDAAYNRIRAARVASKWPIVLDMIADGSLSVTVVRLLSDVLTNPNHEELLRAACHKSKRQVEEMIAALHPQPAVAPSMRRVAAPDSAPAGSALVSTPLLAQPSAGADGQTKRGHERSAPRQPFSAAAVTGTAWRGWRSQTVAAASADSELPIAELPKTRSDVSAKALEG